MQRKQFVTRGETPTLQQLPHSVHVSICPEVLRTVISHLGYGPLCFSTTFLASDLMSNCSFFLLLSRCSSAVTLCWQLSYYFPLLVPKCYNWRCWIPFMPQHFRLHWVKFFFFFFLFLLLRGISVNETCQQMEQSRYPFRASWECWWR